MNTPKQGRTYVLVSPERLESLVKTNFMLGKSVLLFEYLCSRSKYPMYLSARAACEVLGIPAETLISCRQQRMIRPKIYRRQFLYNAYDLLALSLKLNQRNLQNALRRAPRFVVR